MKTAVFVDNILMLADHAGGDEGDGDGSGKVMHVKIWN